MSVHNSPSHGITGSPPNSDGFGPRPGTSPSKSSLDLLGRKSIKSHVVKNILLNRSNSGSLPTMQRYMSVAGGTPPSQQSSLHLSGEDYHHGQSPDTPKSHRGSNASSSTESGKSVDKSLWTVRALKDHPEIADIYDRIKPINRCIALGQSYAYEETLLKDDPLIGGDAMMQLILQHLQFEGLVSSRKSLEEEAKVKYPDYAFNESRLVTLIRTALKDSEKIFSLTLDEKQKDAQQSLEEHLAFMGLLYEEPAEVEDVQIYDESEANILFVEEKESPPQAALQPTNSSSSLVGSSGLTPPTPAANSVGSMGSANGGGLSNSISNGTNPLQQSSSSITLNSLATSGGMSTLSIRNNNNVVDDSAKMIKAASLNKLVILLTPEKNPNHEYTKTFLLTYQSFTTPEKLLQKLIQRYQVPQKAGQSEEEWKMGAIPIQLRVVNVLKNWVKDSFSDLNDKMIQTIKSFCEALRHEGNGSHAIRIMNSLNSQLKSASEDDDQDKTNKSTTVTTPEPKVPKNIWSQSLDIMDVDEEEIARQLTLIDFEMFAAIKPSELLNQSWNKPKLRHRSPNVLALINRFNEISVWTASMILSHDKVKERARVMAKLVKVSEYLMKSLNNFNTSMAILSGLNQASVHRLKFTKEEMPKHHQASYHEVQTTLSNAFSYKIYRELITKANPPYLPYLGVCLTDLTFMEDGNPDFIQGLINFSKRRLVYNVIATVLGAQLTRYNLQPVYQISKLLRNLKPKLDEEDLYRRSLKYEPRNKERNEIL